MKFKVMSEKQIRNITDNFVCPILKGYPEIVSPLTYFARLENNSLLGYTSYSDMGEFYFVGNTFILPEARGKGVYSELLSHRNRCLPDKPKITLVNPINNTNPEVLYAQVRKQGGVEVLCYSDVEEIMSQEMFDTIKELPVFIYR